MLFASTVVGSRYWSRGLVAFDGVELCRFLCAGHGMLRGIRCTGPMSNVISKFLYILTHGCLMTSTEGCPTTFSTSHTTRPL